MKLALCLFATILLGILQLAGAIAVSWWVVFAPLLAWVTLVFLGTVMAALALVTYALATRRRVP